MTGCDKCFHTGAIDAGFTDVGIPITRPCACQIARDIVRNINRAWPNLSSAPKIESSPLSELTGENVYITASDASLRAHLRHVGLRMGAKWGFKVHTDSDLMTAWLAPIAIAGKEILDPEATAVSTERATLVDLTEPPELLILRLGVKSARNSAMGEVLLEALYHRAHIGRPVWVVDQPGRLFNPAHIAFSEDALHHITQWERVALDEVGPGLSIEMVGHGGQEHSAQHTAQPTENRGNSLTLSAGYSTSSAAASATTRIERPVIEPKKKKFKRTEE